MNPLFWTLEQKTFSLNVTVTNAISTVYTEAHRNLQELKNPWANVGYSF